MTTAPKPEDFRQVLDEWCEDCLHFYDGGNYFEIPDRHMDTIREALRRCAHPTPPEGVMSAELFFTDLLDKREIYVQSGVTVTHKAIEKLKARDAQLSSCACKGQIPVSQAKGEGWVLVPKEPTDKMAQAEHDVCPANFETRYKAMITAAPQASGGGA